MQVERCEDRAKSCQHLNFCFPGQCCCKFELMILRKFSIFYASKSSFINIFTPIWKISQPTRAPINALHCSLPQRNKFWFMIWDNKVTICIILALNEKWLLLPYLLSVSLVTNYCLWTELYSELIPNGGLALAILVLWYK